MGQSSRNDADAEAALAQLAVFCLFMLALDGVAKFLITPYFAWVHPQLGRDWTASAAIGAAGLAVVGVGLAKLVRPNRSQLIMPALFAGVSVIATLMLSRYQDFSYDAQWYHFQRVAMFPIETGVTNFAPRIARGPAVFYADLPDNLRGLSLTILRTGAFSGVGVNLGLLAALGWFWQCHCHFLPRLVRWVPVAGPVVAAQLLSYYGDGWVSLLGAAVFLTTVLLALEWRTRPLAPAAILRVAGLTVPVVLVFAQLKFSFPFLLVMSALPLAVSLVSRVANRRSLRGESGAEAGEDSAVGHTAVLRRASLPVLAILAAGGAAALANPYGLFLKAAVLGAPYPDFQPATVSYWGKLAFQKQVVQLFGETSPLLYALKTDVFAIWPALSPGLLDSEALGAKAVLGRLLVQAGGVDSRYSGFGPLAIVILAFAAWRALQVLSSRFQAQPVEQVLAITFFAQCMLSVIYPLGWWARMNPAPYVTATCLVLLPLNSLSLRAWGSRRGSVALACLAILATGIVLPVTVQAARSSYKMGQIRAQTGALAQQVAARQGGVLELPRSCPGTEDFQASYATKFIAAYPKLNLKARFRDDSACTVQRYPILPDDTMCICAAGGAPRS